MSTTRKNPKVKITEEPISDEQGTIFREMMDKLEAEKKALNKNYFVSIKKTSNLDGSDYFYAERKGVDSVAFLLYDIVNNRYGLINEYKPPVGEFAITAFGGSLDMDGVSKVETVQLEALEEAGVQAERKQILALGRALVSTQMNQYCHLYVVLIENSGQIGTPTTDNPNEQKAGVVWMNPNVIKKLDDWKAIMILSKMEN